MQTIIPKIVPKIDVYDEKIYRIIDPNNALEQVVTGFEFVEGPVWNSKEKHLTFSDIYASKIYRWSPDNGLSVLVEPSNKANGNFYDLDGRLVICEQETSLISRINVDGTNREILVSHYQGKELNSPNDIVVKSDGSIYFSDPRYGRKAPNADRAGRYREQELDFQGVYRYDPKTLELTLLTNDFEEPNGLCFSLDEKLLYVADSPRSHIRVFDVMPDGTIGNGRIFAELKVKAGVPDGLKIDREGNVYCAAQGGLHFFDKEGNCLGILWTPENTANFTWGDENLCSMYLTSSTSLYKIRVKIPGL